MTQHLQADRRRLVEALGLGPVWVRRDGSPAVDADAPDDGEAIATLDWHSIQRLIETGRECGLVESGARNVSGADALRPEWLVIGDDADHDAFAGPARRLLDAMLAAIGLSAERTVFVASLVGFGSRADGESPAGEASRACLQRQIELLAPRMILLAGDVAATAVLADAGNVVDLRGMTRRLTIAGRDVPVIATFHPRQLLDDGLLKAQAWAHLCAARTIHEQGSAAVIA